MKLRLIRIDEVIQRTGLSRSTIYNKIRDEEAFPKQIKLSERCVAFVESEVNEWIEKMIADSRLNNEVIS